MKKIIIVVFVVLAYIFITSPKVDIKVPAFLGGKVSPTPTVDNWLPKDWAQKESSDNKLILEKKVEMGLKPEIVWEKSEKKTDVEFSTYTNTLVAGARSAIPTLRYDMDKFVEGDLNQRILGGYYYNQGKKIFINQRIYQKDSNFYTLTASYADSESETEVNSIFDKIVERRLGN